MTKGGSGKSKTLGRLIFGDKRKSHASPARRRSATRNAVPTTDTTTPTGAGREKSPINIQDWAVWRIQLNEQMGSAVGDPRADTKQLRHFLQSNSFYQQHYYDSSNGGQYNCVQLLFSIPRANINPEFFDELHEINKSSKNEIEQPVVYEEDKVRSPSGDRTTSVNSISVMQPPINDVPISQLLPKTSVSNTGGFQLANEPINIIDRIHPRQSIRRSFVPTDRIHATLQKAVKDGNVLEKIKAFEMQAAAAQAECVGKLSGLNYRIQSVPSSVQSAAQHRLSPAVVYPMKNTVSPIPMQNQKQPSIRVSRGRYVHPAQQQPHGNYDSITDHKSRKGAHVLEPAHGDIILKRRTPSQKTANDEDCSITAITSMPLSTSQAHHRSSAHHNYNYRKSASRSRHRQDGIYEKHMPNKNETSSHRHQHKSKERAATASKLSTHRRWLKGRKGATTEASKHGDNKQSSTKKSSKTSSSSKKKNNEQEKINKEKASKTINKEKLVADNNRVYGVPTANTNEQTKIEPSSMDMSLKNEEKHELDSKKDIIDNGSALILSKQDPINQGKECDPVMPMKIQQRSSKSSYKQKLSNTEEEISNKVVEDNRFCRLTTNDHIHQTEFDNGHGYDDNGGENDYDKSDDDVFIEETKIKSKSNLVRHQSVVNPPSKESRRFQQQSSCIAIRRHASQCSSSELTYEKRFQQTKDNPELVVSSPIKKKPPPITIITRNHRSAQNEQLTYKALQSESTEASPSNSHTLKTKRPLNTNNTTGIPMSHHGQTNNTKPVSKQILHAIMNSMNNNQEQSTIGSAAITSPSSVNDEFFENGPLTNPEETMINMTNVVSK